jgi:hypothetical protein
MIRRAGRERSGRRASFPNSLLRSRGAVFSLPTELGNTRVRWGGKRISFSRAVSAPSHRQSAAPPVFPAGAPSRARRAGIVLGLLMTVPAFAGTTSLFVLASGFRPEGSSVRRHAQCEGGAGCRGLPVPTARVQRERTRGYSRRFRKSSGIPRAVFEACSARSPVDVPAEFPRRFAIHRWRGPTGSSVFGTRKRQTQAPCDERQARRKRAAWAAGAQVACSQRRPPLPIRTWFAGHAPLAWIETGGF